MVATLRPQSHARAVVEPKPRSLRLLSRHLETFLTPDPLYALVVDAPAFSPEHGRDPPISVPSEPARQIDDPLDQTTLVIALLRPMTLRGSRLTEHLAGPTLRHTQKVTQVIDHLASTRRAHQFGFAASLRIALSSVRSATTFLSRVLAPPAVVRLVGHAELFADLRNRLALRQ